MQWLPLLLEQLLQATGHSGPVVEASLPIGQTDSNLLPHRVYPPLRSLLLVRPRVEHLEAMHMCRYSHLGQQVPLLQCQKMPPYCWISYRRVLGSWTSTQVCFDMILLQVMSVCLLDEHILTFRAERCKRLQLKIIHY